MANLAFSPGLIRQVSAYRNRLRRETRLRGLGLVMLTLALAAQLFILNHSPQRLVTEVSSNCIQQMGQTNCLPLSTSSPDHNKTLSILVLALMAAIATYLYIRSRLLNRELEVVRQEYNRGGCN